MIDYPNDADGDALRRIQTHGSDMSRPMLIDFHIRVPTKEQAEALASELRKIGYQSQVDDSREFDLDWTCTASVTTLATYDVVIAIQNELEVISKPFGGEVDGWGTLGNVDKKR
jgi:regulator of RNase E activity RraB